MNLKEYCPAFLEGCPYKEILCNITGGEEDLTKCPAFENGCPFKRVKTTEELKVLFEKIPHRGQSSSKAHILLIKLLRELHAVSERTKKQMGNCPQFNSICPFKHNATPELMVALERCTWSSNLSSTIHKNDTKNAMNSSFSKQIKEGTRASHTAAENVNFVKKFIRGNIEEKLYKQLIADLYFVYTVLETRLNDMKNDKMISKVHFPTELNRKVSLEKDMAFWFGSNDKWKKYCNRIKKCNASELIAHAYTRYMGDLSGGRVLMRRAKKSLHLKDIRYFFTIHKNGLSFYVFENIKTGERAFKDKYRQALDSLDLSNETAKTIIAEANTYFFIIFAFLLNMRLFTELDIMGGDSSNEIPPLSEALNKLLNISVNFDEEWKCPFAKFGAILGIKNIHEEDTNILKNRIKKSKVMKKTQKLEKNIFLVFFFVFLSGFYFYMSQEK
eukprot:GSMAST32.ASY1.ANO1.2796.1 assembled CDS